MNDSHPGQAALWMSGAIISFTAMAIAGRSLAGLHDTFEIMTYRSVFGIIIVVAVAAWAKTLHQITRRHLTLHLFRNVFHFIGQNLWFFAVAAGTIPLSQVFALEFTTPIWAAIFAAIFLAEKLTATRIVAAILGFIGALIVAQPSGDLNLEPALIAAAVAALGFAGAAVCTRALVRTETITCVLFYLTAIQAVLGLATAGYDGAIALPTQQSWPWLVIVAICGLVAHFCITKALSLTATSVVMTFDFARLPIIVVVAMVLYNEAIEIAVFIGAILIFAGNYVNIVSEARRSARESV